MRSAKSSCAAVRSHPGTTATRRRRPTRRGDWFRTGDLGYLVDGELIVCGRIKDVIIVGGRNVFPEDVERAAESVEGVRAGNVIAFGTEGRRGRWRRRGRRDQAGRSAPIRAAVAARAAAVGVPPEDVVLVRPGTLPKTSSGKPQRSLCRNRYLGDELTRSERRRVGHKP